MQFSAFQTQAAKITVIGNIQCMEKIITQKESDFHMLNSMDLDSLHDMQDQLLPQYNNAIKSKGGTA